MAFEGLSDKLDAAFAKLRSKGSLTEADVKEAMREGPPMVRNIALARSILIPHSGHRQIAAMQSAQSAATITTVETMPFQYADQNARSSSAPLAITKRNQSPSIVIPKCVRANQSAPRTSRQYPTTAAIPPRTTQPNFLPIT